MSDIRQVHARKTAAAAFRTLTRKGIQWKGTSVHDDLGEVTVYGVELSALDATGLPTNFVAPWVVAATWAGIEQLPGQQILDLLREVQLAASAFYCQAAWKLDRSESEWLTKEIDAIHGTFAVHRLNGRNVFCVVHEDWVR